MACAEKVPDSCALFIDAGDTTVAQPMKTAEHAHAGRHCLAYTPF
jgi:hypothetical protein